MCRLSPHINTRTWIANRALRKGETNMNSPKDTVAVVRDGMYVILGASGNTGSIIANFLLSKGEKVRVVGREVGRLQRFARKGAEAFTADLSDAAALTKAFSGARAAYLMLPPLNSREEQERQSDAIESSEGVRPALRGALEQLRRACLGRHRTRHRAAFVGAKTQRYRRVLKFAPPRRRFSGEKYCGERQYPSGRTLWVCPSTPPQNAPD